MADSKADLIIHPVRMQIIKALGGRELTPGQLADAMPDVSRATLYRHINVLAEAGIIVVVDENPIRGTVEKVYGLASDAMTHLTVEDLRSATNEDHLRFFTVFVTSLLSDFSRYLDTHDQPDFAADGVGYQTHALNVTDSEFQALVRALNETFLPFLQNQPSPERKRLLFSTVVMPSVDEPPAQQSEE